MKLSKTFEKNLQTRYFRPGLTIKAFHGLIKMSLARLRNSSPASPKMVARRGTT